MRSVSIEEVTGSPPKGYKIAFSPGHWDLRARIPLILWREIHANFAAGRIAYSRNSSIEGKEIAFKWAMQIYEGREKGADRRALRPVRPRITCTRESCYANTRQHSAALTVWRAENESPIFADDREEDGGRLYRSRRNDAWLAKRSCRTRGNYFRTRIFCLSLNYILKIL